MIPCSAYYQHLITLPRIRYDEKSDPTTALALTPANKLPSVRKGRDFVPKLHVSHTKFQDMLNEDPESVLDRDKTQISAKSHDG